ncbi:MAG: hypothetical protein ACI84K_001529 [Pseudohongiellaceae bacterium]|jgi:hypothetical protein
MSALASGKPTSNALPSRAVKSIEDILMLMLLLSKLAGLFDWLKTKEF